MDTPGTSLSSGITAILADQPDLSMLPQTASPSLAPRNTTVLADRPDLSVLPQTDSPALGSGTTTTLRTKRPVGKYFFGVGSALTALLIVIAYELGSPSDGPFKGSSEKTGVASHNPSTSVGPSALVSAGIVTNSGDRSIDLLDGGELTNHSSQPQSETSIGSDEVIRPKAMVPVPRPRPAASAVPDERGIGNASQSAQSPTTISHRPKRKSVKARPKRFRR